MFVDDVAKDRPKDIIAREWGALSDEEKKSYSELFQGGLPGTHGNCGNNGYTFFMRERIDQARCFLETPLHERATAAWRKLDEVTRLEWLSRQARSENHGRLPTPAVAPTLDVSTNGRGGQGLVAELAMLGAGPKYKT